MLNFFHDGGWSLDLQERTQENKNQKNLGPLYVIAFWEMGIQGIKKVYKIRALSYGCHGLLEVPFLLFCILMYMLQFF